MALTSTAPTPKSIRRNNNEKKVWRFLDVKPDHEAGTYVCLQELEGDWGTPNEGGHDEEGWRDADLPAVRRVVFMRRSDKDGSLKNRFPGYNGDRYAQRP